MLQIALTSPYGIQLSPTVYMVLAALLVAAGLYIVINPKAFLRWGRGRSYAGKEPPKSALWAARLVGLAVIAMAAIAYLSMNHTYCALCYPGGLKPRVVPNF